MAKSKRESHITNDIPPDEAPAATHSETAKEPLTSEQLTTMFDAVDSWSAHIAELESNLEAAKTNRSESVRAIVEAVGNKGPWNIKGKRISVTERGGRFNMQRESDAKLTL